MVVVCLVVKLTLTAHLAKIKQYKWLDSLISEADAISVHIHVKYYSFNKQTTRASNGQTHSSYKSNSKKNFVAIYKLQMIICITGDLIILFSYAKYKQKNGCGRINRIKFIYEM